MALTDTPVTSDDLTATGTTHESATTTHAFSPGAGSMVLVRLSWMQAGSGTPTTITVADSHGNSYTSQLQAANSFNVAGSAIFWFAYATAPGSTTLTVTSSAASSATGGTTFLVSPTVVTGQKASSLFGPNVINVDPSGSTTTLVTNLVTTVTGSQVYLAGGIQSGSTPTANANTTQTAVFNSANNGFTGLGKTQTGTPGSTAFGWTVSPAAAFGGSMIGVELLPATAASHTATAALTVTPVMSAAAARGQSRTAALTVTPVMSAAVPAHRTGTAALTVTPVMSAARAASFVRSAGLVVTPVMSAARRLAAVRTAALTVTPVLTASARSTAGPPPGYPDGLLGQKVELYLGGTWVDLTAQALPDGQQSGSVKSGQGDGATQPTPSTMNGAWDNPDYSLTPRNADGPYFGMLKQNAPARVSFESPYGAYLRLEADDSDRAYVDDTTALHVAGNLELRLEALPSDYRGCVLAARYDDPDPSWYWLMDRGGTLTFSWFDSGGTQHTVTSPAAASVSWRAFRVTLDAAAGNVEFFVSDGIDGTWTSLGGASGTAGAATTVRAGGAPLVVGWSANLASSQMRGQVSGFRLYDEAAKVADAAFSIQVPDVTSWTDLSGLTWQLAGGAELSARDYRLHGELATLEPTAHQSGGLPKLSAQLAGRTRRLQAGYAPTLDSPMRRAVLTQPGDLYPVDYWTMEDGIVSTAFGPAVGTQLLTSANGKVKPAADSSFEASAPLPTLNGDKLSFNVDGYSAGTGWAVRFLYKPGSTKPATGTSCRLVEVATTGACATVTVSVNDSGNIDFAGKLAGGASAFSIANVAYPELAGPAWWSIEATASGSGAQYNLVAVSPGSGSGNQEPFTVTGHGSFGAVTSGTVNADLTLTDTVVGHLSVQKSVSSIFSLGAPLNAWRTELAADRFARVCAELGITARVIGRPGVTQQMGAQPRGSGWTVLFDCAQTEQGLLFEPAGCLGLGLRTAESMSAQSPAVTLDFAVSNLQGDLQPVDDDSAFLNDITVAMTGGTQYRVTLNDGSANSVSDPKAGGRGTYAGQPPFSFNFSDPNQLAAAAALYLARVSVDEPRYRNIVANFGIPGAPVAAMARARFGDLIRITNVPPHYQTGDVEQLLTGATEAFGPGRSITWNGVPASPYTGTGGGAGIDPDAILDTDGIAILDTDGNQILDTDGA